MKGIFWFIALYISNIVMWLDTGLNVFAFLGKWNETLSSHLGRSFPNSLMAKIVDKLFFWQKVNSHCQHAVLPYITDKNDLLPKKSAEKRIAQVAIFIIFIIVISRLICR